MPGAYYRPGDDAPLLHRLRLSRVPRRVRAGRGPAPVPALPPAPRGPLRSGPPRPRDGPRRVRPAPRRRLALAGAAARARSGAHRDAGRGRHPVPALGASRPGLRGAGAVAQVRRRQSHRLAEGSLDHGVGDQGDGVRLRRARLRLHRQQGLLDRGLRRARRAPQRGVLPEGHAGAEDGPGRLLRRPAHPRGRPLLADQRHVPAADQQRPGQLVRLRHRQSVPLRGQEDLRLRDRPGSRLARSPPGPASLRGRHVAREDVERASTSCGRSGGPTRCPR